MNISELKGKTLVSVDGADPGSNCIVFTCADGIQYKLYHRQDCCEQVSVDDIVGVVTDLLNTPILLAEQVSNDDFENNWESKFTIDEGWGKKTPDGEYHPESHTWTFYKLATIYGYVDIRWFGESNGYYSEGVDFVQVGSEDDY